MDAAIPGVAVTGYPRGPKDRSAYGTSASIGRTERVTSNSRGRSGLMRLSLGCDEEHPPPTLKDGVPFGRRQALTLPCSWATRTLTWDLPRQCWTAASGECPTRVATTCAGHRHDDGKAAAN